jgi:predicted DNA-binding transcriptional regulator AlpA
MAIDDFNDPSARNALQQVALVDINTVLNLTGFKSSTPIYARVKEHKFPAPIRLSRRCSRWRLRDVMAWCEAQSAGAAAA